MSGAAANDDRRWISPLVAAVCLCLAASMPAAANVPSDDPSEADGVPGNIQPEPPARVLPPVALAVGAPSAEEQRSCIEFNASGPTNQCSFSGVVPAALLASLMQSDRFEALSLNPEQVPYSLTLAATTYHGENLGNILSGGLAGASLNLFPVKQEKMVRVGAELRWRGLPLRTLDHELPLVARTHLFQHDDGLQKMHQQLAEALVADIDAGGLLTPEFLYAALQASDYERDLTVPDDIIGLPKRSHRLYPDPFLGVGVMYGNEDGSSLLHVYVYPIAKADWLDEGALLREQAAVAVTDMRIYAQRLESEFKLLGDLETLDLQTDAESLPVVVQRAILARTDGLQLPTALYLFRRGDKFVKIRATNTDQPPLAALAESIQVPDESKFMALLRAGARARSHDAPTHASDAFAND